MKVYKYFNKKYESAFALGLFYINTFGNIRKYDIKGIINDETEGVVHNNISEKITISSSNPQHKNIITDLETLGVIKFNGNGNITMSNFTITNNIDAYMYCVTIERNDNYWNRVPVSQGGPYNGCIEISNFDIFSKQLYNNLMYQDKLDEEWSIGEVFYESNQGTIVDGKTKLPDLFRKPEHKDFIMQKELRIVIPSKAFSVKPKTVYINPKYFKLVSK